MLSDRLFSWIWGMGSRRAGRSGYTLRVVREVRCIFSWHLKMSSVLDSLIAVGNLFQNGRSRKTEGTSTEINSAGRNTVHKRFWLAERRTRSPPCILEHDLVWRVWPVPSGIQMTGDWRTATKPKVVVVLI